MPKAKRERLSDAQRSALWYMGRGYQLTLTTNGTQSVGLLAEDGGRLTIAHRVLDALLNRGLVEFQEQSGRLVFYKLTLEGRAAADVIVAAAKGAA